MAEMERFELSDPYGALGSLYVNHGLIAAKKMACMKALRLSMTDLKSYWKNQASQTFGFTICCIVMPVCE